VSKMINRNQTMVLSWIPRFTGSLSIVGSLSIMFMILSDRKEKLTKPNHRLMLMLSAFDIISSTAILTTTLAFPRESGIYGAAGNNATCTAQGFFVMLGMAVPMYNASLCLFFVLTIRYRLPPSRFSVIVEPFLHAFSVLVPFTCAAVPALMGKIKPGLFVLCWMFDSPTNLPFIMVLCISIMVCLCSMVLIACHVCRQSNAMIRYAYGSKQMQSRQSEKRDTTHQAMLYASACIVTWVFPITVRFFPLFPIDVLKEIFYPLQGFWNFLLYIRPGVAALKEAKPDRCMCGIIWDIVSKSKERTNNRRESRIRGSMTHKQVIPKKTKFDDSMKRIKRLQFEETKQEITSDEIEGNLRITEEGKRIEFASHISGTVSGHLTMKVVLSWSFFLWNRN